MKYEIPNCIYCGLKFDGRINIAPIKIYSVCVNSIMTSANSIWVQNRKNIKYKIIP